MATKEHLFEDVSQALDTWVSTATDSLTKQDAQLAWTDDAAPYRAISEALTSAGVASDAVRAVLSESMRGLAHSIFVVLDGGTSLAEHGRLHVVDEQRQSIGEGLHEGFVAHLLRSGRLT